MAQQQQKSSGLKSMRRGQGKKLLDACPRCKCRRYTRCGCGGYVDTKPEVNNGEQPKVEDSKVG